MILTLLEVLQFIAVLSNWGTIVVMSEPIEPKHSIPARSARDDSRANKPHLQRHHRRNAAYMSLSAQELQYRRQYCNVDTCQDYAFQIWQKYEMQEEPVLKIFKQLDYDYFRSPEYKSNFCRIFMHLQKQCLSLHCDEASLNRKSPHVWSFHARAKERGFKFNFGPAATIEHSIIEGVPDFYMEPALLKTVCEPGGWIPTFPTEQWCANSTHGSRNYPLFLEWILSNNLTDVHTCSDVEWRVNMLSKLLYNYCDNFLQVSDFYCRYHGELIRIYTGINCTKSLNCNPDKIVNATIPPRVLCEWEFNDRGTDDGTRETVCGETGRIVQIGETESGIDGVTDGGIVEEGGNAQHDPDQQDIRFDVFTLLPPPNTPIINSARSLIIAEYWLLSVSVLRFLWFVFCWIEY